MIPACPQLADGLHDLRAAVGVKHGGRLVQHKAVRPHGNDACDGDALLLPAGQLIRRGVALFVDAGQFHGFVDAGADLLRRHAEVLRRKGDILLDDGGDDLVVRILEHHADLLAHIVEVIFVAGVHPLDQHRARFGQQNGIEMLCQRGLAAAVRAQHGDKLAAPDVNADAVDGVGRLLRIIAEAHVLRL